MSLTEMPEPDMQGGNKRKFIRRKDDRDDWKWAVRFFFLLGGIAIGSAVQIWLTSDLVQVVYVVQEGKRR